MLLRLIGSALLVAGSGGIGMSLKWNYQKRMKFLERLVFQLEEMKGLVEFSNRDMSTILEHLPKDTLLGKFFGQVCNEIRNGTALPEAWKSGIRKILARTFLKKRELELMEALGEQLGAGYRENQIRQLEYFQNKALGFYETMKKEEKERCSMYTSFGILGGMFISILFI
jgi:stage III sporulation protein AB